MVPVGFTDGFPRSDRVRPFSLSAGLMVEAVCSDAFPFFSWFFFSFVAFLCPSTRAGKIPPFFLSFLPPLPFVL